MVLGANRISTVRSSDVRVTGRCQAALLMSVVHGCRLQWRVATLIVGFSGTVEQDDLAFTFPTFPTFPRDGSSL